MKVLIVTSKTLENEIEKLLKNYNVDVIGIGEVATLIKENELINSLKKKNPNEYDIILLPGNIKIDIKHLEKTLGINNIYLGTKHYKDLKILFKYLNKIKLSKNKPADELIKDILIKENLSIYERCFTKEYVMKYGKNFIGNLPYGKGFPIRIISEINFCEEKDFDEILNEAKYYLSSGADIIDLGFNEKCPDKVYNVVKLLKSKINVPISIDTMDYDNIKSGIKAGCDLILSLNKKLIEKFDEIPCHVVIIPDSFENLNERLNSIEENIKLAMKKGFDIILDPILKVENIFESFLCYKILKDKYNLPLLAGIGNITEMIDADSIGINAILCKICYEIGIDFMLTTEASDKTKNSVKELSIANRMMFISKIKGIPPKDLGIDLLILKEKNIKRLPVKLYGERIRAKPSNKFIPDKKGYFKIFVNDEYIYCVYNSFEENKNLTIFGKNAKEICDTILEMNLVSNLQHAMYLGREIQKAEFSLKYGKSYVQDY